MISNWNAYKILILTLDNSALNERIKNLYAMKLSKDWRNEKVLSNNLCVRCINAWKIIAAGDIPSTQLSAQGTKIRTFYLFIT